MTTGNTPTPPAADNNTRKSPKRRRPWLTVLKWILGITVGIVLLVIAAVGVAVWILTPERLTPLVGKYGSEMIDGEVKVSRVELTYWSTFPRLQLDVDSLVVVSKSLKGLDAAQRAALPATADSLLSVDSFSGGINILELLRGRIALYDIVINRPAVTLVDVGPGISNYNIFPSDEEPDTLSKPLVVPDLRFSRFTINGKAPIRYISLPDSTDILMTLSSTQIIGEKAPVYRLDYAADIDTRFNDIDLSNLRIGMGGDIDWNHSDPYRIELTDFEAGVNSVNTVTSAIIDFRNNLTVQKLDFTLPQVKVNDIFDLVPARFRGEIDKIDNNLQIGLSARLTKPYEPSGEKYPSMELEVNVPEGSASYEQLKLRTFILEASAVIDGDNPDASTVTIKRLVAIGRGVGFEINGTATSLLSDPMIDGKFKGGIEFSRLPSKLTKTYGLDVSGHLRADARIRTRQSWLDRENFHRINATGEAMLKDFRLSMPDMGASAYIRDAEVRLGTSQSFVRGAVTADSLLTASLKIDTIATFLPGMDACGSSLRAGVGCRNTSASADTSQLNPIGAAMSIGSLRLTMTDNDTTRVRLRDVKARASIKRFRNSKNKPLVNISLDADRLRFSEGLNRASLREASVNLTVHPAPPRIGKKMRARMDSLRAVYPSLPPDSIYRMAAKMRKRRPRGYYDSLAAADPTAKVDYGLDAETTSLLRKWRASGALKAKRARVFTPYFPLRNRLSDINLRFNNDSIVVSNTRYRVGRSDFMIDGTISNLTRAVTSRTGRQALMVNFRVTSDTIDVNQIAAAVFAGAAFAEKERQGAVVNIVDSDDDNAVEKSIAAQADSTAAGPLLIPTNIEATLRLNARNVLYSDFIFNTLRGSVEVYDGAINMRNLSARTDIGSVDLTALYHGIDPKDLNFAFGMQVRDFHVARFLDLVPALDTIMPLLTDMDGIINGEVAAQAALDSVMDIRIPSLNAAVTLTGDSLVLLDAETYRSIGKWMLFKQKERNVIDSMTVRLVVKNSMMQLYPFMFNIDRYKLGVYGNNDLDLNFKYHIAVLKSPIPFKFGINVSGTPDKMKIRLGGAKWDARSATRTYAIADTTRINLVNQIQNLFRRGVRNAEASGDLRLDATPAYNPGDAAMPDTISHADSLLFIREGLIPAPPAPDSAATPAAAAKSKKRKSRR